MAVLGLSRTNQYIGLSDIQFPSETSSMMEARKNVEEKEKSRMLAAMQERREKSKTASERSRRLGRLVLKQSERGVSYCQPIVNCSYLYMFDN